MTSRLESFIPLKKAYGIWSWTQWPLDLSWHGQSYIATFPGPPKASQPWSKEELCQGHHGLLQQQTESQTQSRGSSVKELIQYDGKKSISNSVTFFFFSHYLNREIHDSLLDCLSFLSYKGWWGFCLPGKAILKHCRDKVFFPFSHLLQGSIHALRRQQNRIFG